MAENDREPTFNLGAILRETGIKADTLRAWERRYGLPMPQRSKGGHRLYSRRDIEIIKWLRKRQSEKLSISQAVKLWKSLVAEGKDPLQWGVEPRADWTTVVPATGETIVEIKAAWLAACKEFDEAGADAVLSQAFAMYPPERVCTQVLLEGMNQVGEEWYQGIASVQQEHFTSQLATRRIEAMIAAVPPPTRNIRVLVTAPPTEEHVLILLLAVFLLRRRGIDVVYLGHDVPLSEMEGVVESTRPALAISAAPRLVSAARLADLAEALIHCEVPTFYGGRIFEQRPGLKSRMPAHYVGERVEQMTQIIEAALVDPPPVPELEPVEEAYLMALACFREQALAVESETLQRLADQPGRFTGVIGEFSRNIAAALQLGDVGLLDDELRWMWGIRRLDWPNQAQFKRLFGAYSQAAATRLDERCQVLLSWGQQFEFPE